MRILITGISGYLGYEMAHYFQERGHKVFGADHNRCTEFESVTGSILDLPSQPFAVDAVAHLAGASKLDSSFSELYYYKNNVDVSRKLKGLYPSTPIFMASTTGMYNEEGVVEHKFHYSRTKEAAEQYANVAFRMGTICGVNRQGVCHTVASLMVRDAIEKGKILIAEGEKYRSLISLDNVLKTWYSQMVLGSVNNSLDLYDTCVTIEQLGVKVCELVSLFFGKDIVIERRSDLGGITKQAPYISAIPPAGIPQWNDRSLMLLITSCIQRYIDYGMAE